MTAAPPPPQPSSPPPPAAPAGEDDSASPSASSRPAPPPRALSEVPASLNAAASSSAPSPAASSAAIPPTHPFQALLTPYQASNPQPPSAPPSPPLPSLTLRCLLLTSSIPPPAAHSPFIPYTPYSPPPVRSQDDNALAFRAACWRKRDLTKDEWRRERRGVARWLRWAEGKEVVLVSGQEAVRRFCLDGEGEGSSTLARGRQLAEDEFRSTAGNIPQVGEWAAGKADLVQPFPIHTPLLSLLRASTRVTDTVAHMVGSYYTSFPNGTQAAAVRLVFERGPLAVDYLVEKVPEAWRNAGVNLKRLSQGGGESP